MTRVRLCYRLTILWSGGFESLALAGYIKGDGDYPEEIDKMLRSLYPELNTMIIQYCILIHENDYAIYVTFQESLRRQLC